MESADTEGRLHCQQAPGCPQSWASTAKALPPLVQAGSSSRGLFKGAAPPPPPSTSASCPSPFLELGPGTGTQACRGWKENIASFLLVISPWGDWKMQHSHPQGCCCRAGLVWEKEPAAFTSPFLGPSAVLPPTSPVAPSAHPHPAPRFLILSIITWARPRDPLILTAV